MSDTIDPALSGVEAVAPAPKALETHDRLTQPTEVTAAVVPARDLVRLAQGFYAIFWGLLTTVIVGTQMVIVLPLHPFVEMILAVGVVATLVGSWRLHQATAIGELWRARSRRVLAAAGLLAYFCVFFYMWRRAPQHPYLLGNALAFVLTGVMYMVLFTRAVAVVSGGLRHRDLASESRVFSVGNIGLLLLPALGVIGYVAFQVFVHEADALRELRLLLGRANVLMMLVILLPVALTLSLAWSAKDAVLRQLAGRDAAKGRAPSGA